jgi:proline iminopeptidase
MMRDLQVNTAISKEERIINVRGAMFYTALYGDDESKPVMMILPGGPGFGHAHYVPQVESFLDRVRLFFYDPRGCGKTPEAGDDAAYSLDSAVEDVAALIVARGFSSVILHGTSWGSMVAHGVAARYPQLVSKLILIVGAPSYHFLEKAKANLQERGTPEQIAICDRYLWPGAFDAQSANDYFQVMGSLYSYQSDSLVEAAPNKTCNPSVINRAFGSEVYHFDLRDELQHITAPTLIISGRHDWIIPPSCGELSHSLIKNSSLHIFENAGHAVFKDDPDQYRRVIAPFLFFAGSTKKMTA